MIVELNGLPGCGKTTIKKEMISNKFLVDFKAIGVEEFRGCGKNKIFKTIIKIKRILLILNPRYYDLIVLLYKAIFKSKARNKDKSCNFYEKNHIDNIYNIFVQRIR